MKLLEVVPQEPKKLAWSRLGARLWPVDSQAVAGWTARLWPVHSQVVAGGQPG